MLFVKEKKNYDFTSSIKKGCPKAASIEKFCGFGISQEGPFVFKIKY